MPPQPREKRQWVREKDRPSEEFVFAVEGGGGGLYDRDYYFRAYVADHQSREGRREFMDDAIKWLRTRFAQAGILPFPEKWPYDRMHRVQQIAECLDAVRPELHSAFVHLQMYLAGAD